MCWKDSCILSGNGTTGGTCWTGTLKTITDCSTGVCIYDITKTFTGVCPGIYYFYFNSGISFPANSCFVGGILMDTVNVVINSAGVIQPHITITGDTLISSYASAYQWYFNGTSIPNATDSFYVTNYLGSGTYNVAVTDSNGCKSFSNGFLHVGVHALPDNSLIHIFPNPAGNELHIQGLEPGRMYKFNIYNLLGETVFSISSSINKETTLDISSLAKGIYILELQTSDKAFRSKIVKE